MKYHNFKRPLAVILASLLTFSSASFVASAQETGEENQGATTITYTFRGESSDKKGGGDYTVEVLANGGKINTGFVEITYDEDLYSGVTFTPANNIKDASFYWDVDNEAGTYGVGFMSAAGLSDGDAGLFADIENPSTNIAYIDASKEGDLVKIGTFTLTFAEGNSYATAFTTNNAEASAVTVKTAKYILHDKDGYDTTKYDAAKIESTMLVFSAGDFTVKDTETTYNSNAQKPTVTSGVAKAFTLDLNGATEQTDADTYPIKVKNVSGEGYYDAEEIDLAKNFVIQKKEVTITAPVADPAAEEYVPNGFDPADITLSSKDWEVTDTALLNVGEYNVNVKYVGTFDTDNNIYKFNEAEVTDKEAIVATVAFEVTKAEGEVPALTTTYEATYDSTKDQTVTGYGVELSEGWEWVNANSSLSIGDNKDIAVKFIPEDVANYTYVGYDAELGYVPGKVTVTLNKAEGTAPALPVVTASVRRDTLDTVIKASDLVTNAGEWSYNDAAELTTGDNTITFTYKPNDLDKVDYEGLANWNAETNQFEYSVTVKVLAPYFDPTGIYPPTNPAAVNFEEGKTFTAADFALANDWEYAEAFELTSAGTTEDVKVLYEIPAGYDGIDPAKTEYTVEDGNIVYYVDLTVNRIAIPNGAITFSQTSDYTGSAIALEKANIAITGLTGVTADNVTLVAVAEVDAGTYDVLATVAETTNYNAITTAVKIGTLTISPIDVTANKFTLEYKSVEYDGNAKMPTVTATSGVGAVATVKYYNNAGTEVTAPTDYGTYTVKVSGPANGNYKEYTDFEVGTFSITKHQVTITAPTALDPVNYVPGGYDLANLVVTGWTVVTTGKLNAGEHDVTIAYNGDFDTTNYSYIYNGEEVTDKAAITATLKLTVNKIAGTVTAPAATQTVTFDPAKGDKKASTYATFADDWSIAEDKDLAYGANAITVEHAADTLNYTWDGYTVVGEGAVAGKITKVVDVTFVQKEISTTVPPVLAEGVNNKVFVEAGYKYSDFTIATEGWVYDTPDAEITSATTVNAKVKYEIGADYKLPAGSAWTVEGNYIVDEIALTVVPAELPADAAVAAVTTETYDGSAKSVNVSAKADYTGLGEFTVSYEGNTNAGTYDVYVDFADGTNYKGGKITLTDYLVINKADVTKDMFTVADYEHKYDGNAKTANVTVKAEYAEIGAPTVTYNPAEVKAVGEYAIIVAGDETANYNAYSNITLDTKLTIAKGKIVIQKPEVGYDVDYVEGGFDLSTVKIDGWTTISTQKVDAGKSAITVKYAGTLDTDNYEYEFDGATVTYPPTAYPTIIVRKINLPADPLKIDDNNFTYNGSAQKATVSLKNTLTGVGTIAVTYKQGETVVADPTDAGTYDVYATVATGKNYYGLTETKIGSYEIKRATVEKTDITVSGTEHTYDGNAKAPTATSTKGGTAVVTVTGEAINAGTYTFTVSGEATTNYEAYSFTYEDCLVIKRADVKESDFTVSDKSQPYDGSEKAPTVTKVTEGIGEPQIQIKVDAINAGNYTYTVSGAETQNYNKYSFEYTDDFVITKRTITIAKPENLGATNYTPGGINASAIEYPENWAYNDETDKKLEAGVDQAIKVKYTATLDTANNDYVAGEGVEGNANDGFTSTVTITVNQIAGTIPALTTSYEATYDKEKADKKVTSYITIADAKWTLTDADAVLEYGEKKYAVETVLDTKNYTYTTVEGVTVGDGKATAEITVKFNKASIPADGFSIAKVETEYNGDDKSVEVVKNDTYNGLGDATIVYHEGRTDAGTYDVKIIVSEGDNYVGSGDDGIVFEDVLVITKNKLSSIDTPVVATEMIVGTVITGDAGNNWTYVDTTIVAGDNTVTVTKTIDASTAKNYDFEDAADAAGVVITPITEGENAGGIVLTKTYAVTGKYSTGTLKLTINTKSAHTADANTGDVTITILPEGGTAYELATDKFTESADLITVADLILTEGKYTITVKKQRYLAYVLTLNVTANSTTEKTIELVAGDIVGGEEGKEIMGDGVIDIDDFVIAIRAFDDASSDAVKAAADIDEDGNNNVIDLGFIKANFNKTTAGNCTEDTTNTNG